MNVKKIFHSSLQFWKSFIVVGAPIVLSPLVILSDSEEARCGYVMLVMAAFWVTEALPTAVTALIPIFAFPLFGLMSTGDVSKLYMKETNMMFFGGLVVAIAVEQSNLHQRIALFIILRLGQSPMRLTAGFMLTTMFLSMWISNTASTAMMVPIVDAILQEIYTIYGKDESACLEVGNGESYSKCTNMELHTKTEITSEEEEPFSRKLKVISEIDDLEVENLANQQVKEDPRKKSGPVACPNEKCKAFKDMLFLATAYGANLGGTGTITGTGPNLVLRGILNTQFSEQSNLNFASWMLVNIPGMLVCCLLTFMWLYFFFMGFGKKSRVQTLSLEEEKSMKRILQKKYHDLGPMTFNEIIVLFWFVMLVLLWFFRSPGFMVGWGDKLTEKFDSTIKIGDATPALLIAFILFCVPSRPNFLCFRDPKALRYPSSSPGCLTWDIVHEKIPWGILLLIGGGLAMAVAAQESGLSLWLGKKLLYFNFMAPELLLFCICILSAMATEITSNTATASVLLPVLKELSLAMCLNPLFLMLPVTLCCSFAFMLPVATAPNAIVYGAANLDMALMMKVGLVPNLLCVLTVTLFINTYAIPILGISTFPAWANSSLSGFQPNC